MGKKVILIAGSGPMARMPREIEDEDRIIRCITNDTLENRRGLLPDLLIVKDEFLSEELDEEIRLMKQVVDTVIDLRFD